MFTKNKHLKKYRLRLRFVHIQCNLLPFFFNKRTPLNYHDSCLYNVRLMFNVLLVAAEMSIKNTNII